MGTVEDYVGRPTELAGGSIKCVHPAVLRRHVHLRCTVTVTVTVTVTERTDGSELADRRAPLHGTASAVKSHNTAAGGCEDAFQRRVLVSLPVRPPGD